MRWHSVLALVALRPLTLALPHIGQGRRVMRVREQVGALAGLDSDGGVGHKDVALIEVLPPEL